MDLVWKAWYFINYFSSLQASNLKPCSLLHQGMSTCISMETHCNQCIQWWQGGAPCSPSWLYTRTEGLCGGLQHWRWGSVSILIYCLFEFIFRARWNAESQEKDIWTNSGVCSPWRYAFCVIGLSKSRWTFFIHSLIFPAWPEDQL